MSKLLKLFLNITFTSFVLLLLYNILATECYYVTYNTYVQNNKGEMVEQDEFKHSSVYAKSLKDAKKQIFEAENKLYEDVIVDSVAVQDYIIVRDH